MDQFEKLNAEMKAENQPAYGNESMGQDLMSPPPKKTNKKAIAILLIAVLVLGIAGFVTYALLQPEKVEEASVSFDVPTEIAEWGGNGELCVAEVGKTALDIPFVPGNPEAYEIEIAYVKEVISFTGMEFDMELSKPFTLDNSYIIGFNFKVKEGYEFTENTKFTVPVADNIAGAEGAQFEITTRAADLAYKPLIVAATKEADASTYTFGNQRLTAHVTGLSKTVYDCNRIQYRYSFRAEDESVEEVQWDLYARTEDGGVHNIHSFASKPGGIVGDVIELDETLDINGFFLKPTSGNLTKWGSEFTVTRIYSAAE